MGRVHVLGSINRDLVIRVRSLPRPGETVSGSDFRQFPGGKGANQAVAAARAGTRTRLVGALGDDAFGAAMRDFLAAENIDLSALRVLPDTSTGIALIAVDQEGENTIIVSAGANAALAEADAESLKAEPGDVVAAQFEVPESFIRVGFARARAAGARTLLNPAPMKPIAADLLALTDILVLNETELGMAAGTAAPTDPAAIEGAARSLAQGARIVIVTLGAEGCLAVGADETLRLPGEKVVARDTTGAGDCFVGYLAAGLAGGIVLGDALRRANLAAALSVTREGAASSIPHAHEVAAP